MTQAASYRGDRAQVGDTSAVSTTLIFRSEHAYVTSTDGAGSRRRVRFSFKVLLHKLLGQNPRCRVAHCFTESFCGLRDVMAATRRLKVLL
jgi:hypothetical protein